jgi:hypothetical protein
LTENGLKAAAEHLKSSNSVLGYAVMATDGVVGHVEKLLFDDQTWAIEYVVADTREWLPGKHVTIPRRWLRQVRAAPRQVVVAAEQKAIETRPEYHCWSPPSGPGTTIDWYRLERRLPC